VWVGRRFAALYTGMERFAPNRVPQGVPTGGQYAPMQRAESEALLDETDRTVLDSDISGLLASRRETLERAGYLAPVSLRCADLDPASSAWRQEW
jgi:hypothetical protein